MQNLKLLLVGCGKMGTAILKGWLNNQIQPKNISVIESAEQASTLQQQFAINTATSLKDLDNKQFDVVFFAVKPSVIGEIITSYQTLATGNCLFVSIIAGKKISFFEQYLGITTPIIRTMPNLPAVINQGITAYYPSHAVTKQHKQLLAQLLQVVGDVIELEKENDLDIVTAISGSGPAYYYYFTECLIKAALNLGLPKEIAVKLAEQTFIGGANLLAASELNVEALIEQVATKGGTTEAALNKFKADYALQTIVFQAAEAAMHRSIDLSKDNER